MADIYKAAHSVAREFSRVESDPRLADADRTAFLGFMRNAESRDLAPTRVSKFGVILRSIASDFGGPVTQANEETVRAFVRRLEQSPRKAWTKHDYKVILKCFLRWHRGGEEYPPEVRWVRTTVKQHDSKLPEDLLTMEEVDRLLEVADNLRDRALIAVLYEAGLRIGELLTMSVASVQFIPEGAKVTVRGKTGGRRVLLVASAPILAAWLSVHPWRRDPQAPLWPVQGHAGERDGLRYDGFIYRLKSMAKRASITKRIHPHLFRHSRASHVANRLTEAQMNAYFGWIQGSDMPRTYVHLSGRDVDNAVLALYGKQRDEVQGREQSPECPRCHAGLPTGAPQCPKCWLSLMARAGPDAAPTQEVEQAQDLMAELVKNPLFLEALAQVKAARSTPPGAAEPSQAA